MRITAAVTERVGAPFKIESLELEPPRAGEVLVRIAAAGVCHSDLHVVKGHTAEPLPTVLGHEGSGVVEALGPGVSSVKEGQPVALAWARGCGACVLCSRGQPYLCQEGITGGVLPAGGSRLRRGKETIYHYGGVSCFATHAVMPESMLVPVPAGTDLEVAALVGCAVTTGVGAVINTARVPPGASAAVIGCGGVGLSILQGLRMVGASRIVAVDMGAAKLETARAAGASDAVDASSGDAVAAVLERTSGGADYVFEAVGSPATVRQAVAMTAIGGAAVIVGVPPDNSRLEISLDHLWRGERRVLCSMYGSSRPRVEFPRLLTLNAAGRLDLRSLIARRYPLERINEAYADLEAGAPGRGVLILGESRR
jgi:S-(hydroxymethyl)glutathione dehydrogenase/alcohol dehydrogenase